MTGEIYSFSAHTTRFLSSTLESSSLEEDLEATNTNEPLPDPPRGAQKSVKFSATINQFMTANTVYSVASNRSGSHFAACGEDGRTTLHKVADMSQCCEMYCREDVADDDLDAEDFELDEWFEQRAYMQSFHLKLAVRAVGFWTPKPHECDATLLITGGETETLDVWDVTDIMDGSGASLTSPNKRFKAHECWISEIQFLPALEDVFVTGDVRGKVVIWRGEVSRNRKNINLHCLWLLRCHISMVTSISFCHSTYSMSTSGVDGKVAVWSVSDHVFEDQAALKVKPGRSFEDQVMLEHKQVRMGGRSAIGEKLVSNATLVAASGD